MNKTAIKNFAIWARNKLIADIVYQAGLLGVTEKGIASALPQSTREVQFFDIGTKDYMTVRGKAVQQREAFVAAIKAKQADTTYADAFRFVVEKVAYTWFNRLIAIRFMEVNDYLPGRVRVLSSENPSKAEPDMVTRPFDTDMSFSTQEQDEIMQMKDENKLDELFRMLFVKQCHKLYEVLPNLFEGGGIQCEDSYLELLLTISFTDKDGVLWHLVHDIAEDDFNVEKEGQVEIIGWMYQYYNTEPKDHVFANLKKNIKISKDNIPAATQLFTPDWIVRYMVENSLGRLWVEGHPNEELKKNWKYYLEEAEQEPQVQAQLAVIRKQYAALRPEEIKVIDPCMGSGHILVYLFDVLMQIYESQGWTQREAAQSIVQNNLFGLDIDDRAAQLAYFAVMMKARQYDRRFLERGITPHVYGIQESNNINRDQMMLFGNGMSNLEKNNAQNQLNEMLDALWDAKEYGSILDVPQLDWELLCRYTAELDTSAQITMDTVGAEETLKDVQRLVAQAQVMEQKYNVVVTNPPYMGNNGMGEILLSYIRDYYADSKADLYAVFIEKCSRLAKQSGFISMITQHSWMFLASYETLRMKMNTARMITLAHLGPRAFDEISGEVVQTVSFVFSLSACKRYYGKYVSLLEGKSEHQKQELFISKQNQYICDQDTFKNIQGCPYTAYWASKTVMDAFAKEQMVGDISEPRVGMATANNDRFVRLWHEVSDNKTGFQYPNRESAKRSGKRWFPFAKGGEQRKWYGNNDTVVNWENDGYDIQNFKDEKTGRIRSHNYNLDYIFQSAITWTVIGTDKTSFRICPIGFLYSNSGYGMFCNNESTRKYLLGFMNSEVAISLLRILSPSMGFESGYLRKLPLIIGSKENVVALVDNCISISRDEWDSYETSWDFKRHPLLRTVPTLANAYAEWEHECNNRFRTLQSNEKELNRLFIDIYGLQDELAPEVADKDVTVRRADLSRDIRSLISYAVGCMLGRYSLDVPGLVYAGGTWDSSKYTTYQPDLDNCIPITDEAYFEDDIVGRFVDFIRMVYGSDTLEENLTFIANAIGNKGNTSREVIRNYFLNDFMKDHLKVYQKRPIYWLFDSGKQNGFKALVYMHRWNADTVGNLRVEYLHRMQRVYEKEIERMQDTIDNSRDNREVNQASKRREKLVKQLKEARDYDAKIAHVALSRVEIDLDDGVKVNYEKVQKGPDGKSLGILAKI